MPRLAVALVLLWILVPARAGAQEILAPIHYDLEFDINYDAEALHATAGMTLENPSSEPVREVSLLLYRLMTVSGVRGEDGADLPFTQRVVAVEDFDKQQVNQVVVTLPTPLAPHARTSLRLRYDGHLLGYAETGMLYVQDRIDTAFTILRMDSYAYPQPGVPSERRNRAVPLRDYTYAARITVPKGMRVANGGRLEGVDITGDRATFRFSSLKPSWRMDFACAVYEHRSTGAFGVYFFPADSVGAAGVLEAAARSMELFTRWFGPLPGQAALTFIEIPDGWGSQADVTTVIQTAAAFRDPSKHREVYHEISHLWNVPATDLPSPRWNEGLASFLEDLAEQELAGKPLVDARATRVVRWLRETLPKKPEWRQVPLVDYGKAGSTDLAYSVGDLFFDLLYRLAGRDAFNGIVREYDTRFESGGSTDDLMKIVRRRGGAQAAALVDDWIYTTKWADRVAASDSIQEVAAHYRRAGPR